MDTERKLLEQEVRELMYHHRVQSEHFRPFGVDNVLTKFHAKAAETLAAIDHHLKGEPEALLTTHEAVALMNHPAAIDALIGYHDACDAGIDAFWDIETDGPRPLYHAHRRKALYELGRSIMAEDLDIWPDDLRQAFGFPPLPTEGGVRKDSTTAPKGESTTQAEPMSEDEAKLAALSTTTATTPQETGR